VSLLSVRLVKKTEETPEISTFEFVACDGGDLPAFEAGAHVDFHLPGGRVRSYSLCGDPGELQRYYFAVLREVQSRGGSLAMHQLQEGDVVSISAPKNCFPLADAPQHVLLAGGIGITPLLSMAHQLQRENKDFVLHYAARSASNAAFVAWLKSCAFTSRVRCHFDDGVADQRLNLLTSIGSPTTGRHLYVCGPQGLIDASLTQARSLGWPEDHLHYELFGAQVAQQEGDSSFAVVVKSSAQRFEVPADKTVIQVLHEAGIDVPIACEQGICGTCLTGVLDGVPDHRDQYLTPEEQAANNQFTPCCSRSKTSILTLDL